uniref:Sulfotransferase domain-containing protein n=1 Tax=Clastoptera arizonana TaxID=38151 RepID=A0A1B6E0W1_9HEMI
MKGHNRNFNNALKNFGIYLIFLCIILLGVFTSQPYFIYQAKNSIEKNVESKNIKEEKIKKYALHNSNQNGFVINNERNLKNISNNNEVLYSEQLQNSKDNMDLNMKIIIDEQKTKIMEEMHILNNISKILNSSQPIRNLIVTTFRSGSTFTNEIINSHPGTFNYFEPLLKLEYMQASKLIKVTKDLFQCNIPDWYFEHIKQYKWELSHNYRLNEYCNYVKVPICIALYAQNTNLVYYIGKGLL